MFKNIELETMNASLDKHLSRRDIIGYGAARNRRVLDSELIEYNRMKESLILKYGEDELDESGTPTGRVSLRLDSPKFADFVEEMDAFARIESDPNLFKLKYTDVAGVLTGEEILEIDWMLED